MPSDIQIVAIDATGTHLVRILRAASGSGTVVQVLNPASASGLHRTWHGTGYVHDKTTNPPSTYSTGQLSPPAAAARELWAAEDLRAGALSNLKQIAGTEPNAFVIDLGSTRPFQRFEGWYADPAEVSTILMEVGARAQPGTLQQYQDSDAGRARLLFAFVPVGA